MLKVFIITSLFSLILNSNLVTQAAENKLDVKNNQTSQVQTSNSTETPVCYMQTPDGNLLDLSSLCQGRPKNNNAAKPVSSSAYNYSAIKKFDDELYGEGN